MRRAPLAALALLLVPALVAQSPTDATTRARIDSAAARRAAPVAYTARLETGLLVTVRTEGGREEPHTTWRTASVAHVGTGGAVRQRVVGVQAGTLRLEPADLRALRGGWWIPSLAGESFALRQQVEEIAVPGRTARRIATALAPLAHAADGGESAPVVHPLARDRWRYYTAHEAGEGRVRIVPRADAPRDRARFRGVVTVDVADGTLVEGHGRIDGARGDIVGYVEWRDARGALPPTWQRVTLRHGNASPFDPARRVVLLTRLAVDATTAAELPGPPRLAIVVDTGAALRGYSAWLPTATDADRADIADALLPDAERRTGRPVLERDPTHAPDVFRFNRVEGAFTGLAARLRFRDAAPGLIARASVGWAWGERTARGRVALQHERGDWRTQLSAARLLDPTDDFRAPHDSVATWPALLLSNDPFDYVDRRVVRLGIARQLGAAGPAFGARIGLLEDRQVRTELSKGLLHGPFLPVRGVAEGRAVQATLWMERNPDVWTALPVHAVGVRLRLDHGQGSLDWTRVQGSLMAHRPLTPTLGLQFEGHAGALLGGRAIPQQLFEVGGTDHLAPYRPKEFAGDRIVIARATLVRRLPWLRRPIPVVGGWMLPAPAPALAAGVNTAWTGASSAGRAAIDLLGLRYDPETGRPVQRPDGSFEAASRPTGGVRATTSLGLRFFGGAIFTGIGYAIDGRPDAPGGVRWAFGFGGVL
jgi:hypothetical protein